MHIMYVCVVEELVVSGPQLCVCVCAHCREGCLAMGEEEEEEEGGSLHWVVWEDQGLP